MIEHQNATEAKVNFVVTCDHNHKRGIYLRESYQLEKPYECMVHVDPQFIDKKTGMSYILAFIIISIFKIINHP